MALVIAEAQARVKTVYTFVEVVHLEMNIADAKLATNRRRVGDRLRSNAGCLRFGDDIELVDQRIAPTELKRVSEGQHHVACERSLLRFFALALENNHAAKRLVRDQFMQEAL